MKNVRIFLLCLLVCSASCNRQPDIGAYFGRPKIAPTIMNKGCTGYRNGKLVKAENFIGVDSKGEFGQLDKYHMDIEKRLYFCLKYNDCK